MSYWKKRKTAHYSLYVYHINVKEQIISYDCLFYILELPFY